MSLLSKFCCPIPVQEMKLLETFFFNKLKGSLVSIFLHHEREVLLYQQRRGIWILLKNHQEEELLPQQQGSQLTEPILCPRNYHMAAALMMPSVIESLALELMELFLRRRTKPIPSWLIS